VHQEKRESRRKRRSTPDAVITMLLVRNVHDLGFDPWQGRVKKGRGEIEGTTTRTFVVLSLGFFEATQGPPRKNKKLRARST